MTIQTWRGSILNMAATMLETKYVDDNYKILVKVFAILVTNIRDTCSWKEQLEKRHSNFILSNFKSDFPTKSFQLLGFSNYAYPQHPLSFYNAVGHFHLKAVSDSLSPRYKLCHQHYKISLASSHQHHCRRLFLRK